MHRDLKPENLLTKGDVVKIADFGLAKEIRSRPPFTEYVSTRWYRAPEIILRSTHYNSPIDIWACGVIFAELYLNRPLFPGASDTDQLFKICSILGPPNAAEWDEGYQLARRLNIRFPPMAPTPLRQIIPNAHPAAIDLIEQMLKYNPSERPTVTMCLQHQFLTGHTGPQHEFNGALATQTHGVSSLYAGISTGLSHNPFHAAAGVPSTVPQGPTMNQQPSAFGQPNRFPNNGINNSPTPQGSFGLPNYNAPSAQPQQRPPFNSANSSSIAAAYGGYQGSPTSPTGQPLPYQPLYANQPAGASYSSGGSQMRTTNQRPSATSSFDEFQY